VGIEFRTENLFKKLEILLLTSQCMLSLLLFVVQNKNFFLTNNENHNIDTRQRNNLYLPQANLTIYQKGACYSGIKIFNNLSLEIKIVGDNQKRFIFALKKFLYTYTFYTMKEYLTYLWIMYYTTRFLIIVVH
jgi:hypothetical protein